MSRDFVGYGRNYPTVEWPDKARIAVSFVVNYEVGAESSIEEGDPTAERMSEVTGVWPVENRRDFTVESTYQYESHVGVWRLFDLFDKYDVKTTFFACGQALEKTPEVAREITSRGHEPCSHGYRWVERHLRMNRYEEREEIRRTVEAIERTTGERPYGWFYRGGPTVNSRELLAEEGFLYDSHAFDDKIPYLVKAAGHNFVVVPYSNDVNDFHFWLNRFSTADQFYQYVKDSFDYLYKLGEKSPRMMSVGLHPRIIGRPGRIASLEHFLQYTKGFPKIWFAKRVDIAKWWLDCYV